MQDNKHNNIPQYLHSNNNKILDRDFNTNAVIKLHWQDEGCWEKVE